VVARTDTDLVFALHNSQTRSEVDTDRSLQAEADRSTEADSVEVGLNANSFEEEVVEDSSHLVRHCSGSSNVDLDCRGIYRRGTEKEEAGCKTASAAPEERRRKGQSS